MTYTYTDEDGDTLSMTRCDRGLHLVAVSVPKDSAIGLCVASADVPKFVSEAIGWADADLLSESQRFQADLAREKADRWFQDNGPDIYGTARALADAIRDLLAIVDQVAPEPKER